ncbi:MULTISPECIES: metallophosphoesterase family protein [unclassified Bartonella]|uniref:metallophosphoesterase family protein n=1 Tax=unclassified Bartonella TaxID=2645622 RepID=UPI0009991C7E|nr:MULTISPECIES: metallophosphoesterase [unclassified Bartonella]AQX27583.1 3',5'-cyclic AMP phosphodiesterase CpdA [Bartonella sp. JB15]AQX28864.1 3',5'-cyclic AMP phosphodiesterase CpdA [Bartonella sp. JB63]
MFYLAHISDVHLSPLPQPSLFELCGKRLTGYLNWKKKRHNQMKTDTLETLMHALKQKKPDHIVISGDLINLALDKEFTQARSWLFAQNNPQNISLTFGNHDAYVRGAFQKACTCFQPWIKSDFPQKKPFPYIRIRNNIAIIGTSSAIATPPFQAAGYFDKQQAKILSKFLNEAAKRGLFRIITIHHPPFYHATSWHKKLWGIERFLKVIKHHGCELILHGHTHLPTLNIIEGKMGKIPIVGVASASQSFGGKRPPANFNLFTIEYAHHQWQCQLQRYGIINHNNEIACIEKIDF